MSLLDIAAGAHQKLLQPSGGCHNCPRKLVDFVPATLALGKVLWLGEAPGETEVEKQEGFVGSTGQLLRREAAAAGVPEPWSFSNAIHCRPPNNATPKPKELECCLSQFVLDEIRDYPFVVMCGAVALSTLFPKALSTHYRGNIAWHPDFPGQRFYNIYHPSYISRRPELKGAFKRQLERLARIVAGEPAPPWTLLSGGGEGWWAALEQALVAPLISLDLETTALESWEPHTRIRSFSITSDEKTVVFAHEHEAHWIPALVKIQAYLLQPEKNVVGSNIGFDLDMLEYALEFKIQCTGIHELGVIWNEARQYKQPSQKQLVAEELDGYRYLVYAPSKETDLILLANYNAEDVIYALQLFKKGIALLKPKTRDLVTRVLGPTTLVLRQMSTTGIYLRQDYRRQKIEEYEDRRRAVVAAWHEEDPEFLPSKHESGKGLHKYIFEIHKLPIISHTESKGAAALDQASIKRWIRDGAGYLRHLLEMKEIDKILSTYLTAYDKYLGRDSRIHCKFILARTDTGRPASQQPNLQNISRLVEIRDLFGVPPGAVLMEADLSQMEFRIMVCLAKDETGITMYLKGGDAHTTTAKAFAPNPTKEQRNQAKPVNFALVYGGNEYNVQTVAFNDYGLDWPIEQCQQFTKGFFDTYTRLPEFHIEAKARFIQNRGWFESAVGHIFHYRDWDNPDKKKSGHAFRSCLNSEAQGPCAQICFAILVHARRLLNKRGLSAVRFVNTVHDSVLIEIPNPKQVPTVVETMEEARAITHKWVESWFVVPLVMDYKIGESWGSLEDYPL